MTVGQCRPPAGSGGGTLPRRRCGLRCVALQTGPWRLSSPMAEPTPPRPHRGSSGSSDPQWWRFGRQTCRSESVGSHVGTPCVSGCGEEGRGASRDPTAGPGCHAHRSRGPPGRRRGGHDLDLGALQSPEYSRLHQPALRGRWVPGKRERTLRPPALRHPGAGAGSRDPSVSSSV